MINIGLVLLRLTVGLIIGGHGTQKLSYHLGGDGIPSAIDEFANDGFRGGRFTALLAGGLQVAAGLGLIAGFLVPLDVAGLIGVMLVAASTKRGHGFWTQHGGPEYPLVLVALVAICAVTGPGTWSIDHLVGLSPRGSAAAVLASGAIAVGVIGATLSLPLLKAGRTNDPTTPHPPAAPSRTYAATPDRSTS